MADGDKIKIVHLLGKLNPGGIEIWLLDMLVNTDKESYRTDYIVTQEGEGALEGQFENEGARIHAVIAKEGVWRFSKKLYRLLKREKYDVVHSHAYYFSGYVCFIAWLAGVPVRISHSHTDTYLYKQARAPLHEKAFYWIRRQFIRVFSNLKIACSRNAGYSLFRRMKYETAYCCVDFSKFFGEKGTTEEKMRAEMNIPGDAIVIGHVGRFIKIKNQEFLVSVFEHYRKKNPNSYLLFCGDGCSRPETERLVRERGVEQVLFLGVRDDVPQLMRKVFDILVLPSVLEGLPVVILEAQAAGLKSLLSTNVTDEGNVVQGMVEMMPLSAGPAAWAEKVEEIIREKVEYTPMEIEGILKNSPFVTENSLRVFQNLYSAALSAAKR